MVEVTVVVLVKVITLVVFSVRVNKAHVICWFTDAGVLVEHGLVSAREVVYALICVFVVEGVRIKL